MCKEIKCPVCKGEVEAITKEAHICNKCDIVINTKDTCPDCGAITYEANDPGKDLCMGKYCGYSHKSITDQFITREEYIEMDGDNYISCESIVAIMNRAELNSLKITVAEHINNGEHKDAFNLLDNARAGAFECSESECDSCPIVKAATKLRVIPDNHGQYPTCTDYMDHVLVMGIVDIDDICERA